MKKNSIFSKERKEDLEKMMSRVKELLYEDTNRLNKVDIKDMETTQNKKEEESIKTIQEISTDEKKKKKEKVSKDEKEFEDLKNEVIGEMAKDEEIEEEIHLEKDAIGRTVLAEAEDGDGQETEGGAEQSNETDSDEKEDEKNGNEQENSEGDEKGDTKDSEDSSDKETDDKTKEENEKGPLKPGETTHLQSFDELFKETNTKLKIQKETSEPSPLFGENMKDHNKYKITLTNDKGGDLIWYYWDSEKNTENKVVPTTEVIMKDFGKKLESVVVGISFDNFKKEYGYDNVEESLAQKQYEAMRKLKDSNKKIFPDQHNVYQLIQLSKKD